MIIQLIQIGGELVSAKNKTKQYWFVTQLQAFVDCVPDEAEESHFPPSHLAQFLLCKQQPSLVHTVLCRPRFVPASLSLIYAVLCRPRFVPASLSLLYALQLPGCWDCSHVPPHLAYTVCLFGSDLLFRMTPSFSVKVYHSASECKKM